MAIETSDSAGPAPNLTPSDDSISRRNRDRPRRPTNLQGPRQGRFNGRCDDLNGNIYDCTDVRQADQYTKTTKEIAEYIGRTYKYGMDTRLAIENLQYVPAKMPDDPEDSATKTELRIWEKRVDDYVKRETTTLENLKTAYSLIWGQCSDLMRQRLESTDTFQQISTTGDAIGLLKVIKSITYNYQSQRYMPQAIHEAKKRLYQCFQGSNMPVQTYYDRFMNLVDVVEHIGGSVGLEPGLLKEVARKNGKDIIDLSEEEKQNVKEQSLAVAFIFGSDKGRFSKLLDKLQNDFLQGYDGYPKTMQSAYNLLSNWKHNNFKSNIGANDGILFATTNSGIKKKSDKSLITCHKCKKLGHYANECPENNTEVRPDVTETSNVTTHVADEQSISGNVMVINAEHSSSGFHFNQLGNVNFSTVRQSIPSSWILLDNQSTIDVFCNPSLLTNIRKVKNEMVIRCTAGTLSTDMVGNLSGYGDVWYHKNGIANILSLSQVCKKGYKVTFSSDFDNRFTVEKHDGTIKMFKQSPQGLYYLDTASAKNDELIFITTVDDKASKYTNKDYSHAYLARRLQRIIGRPSTRYMLHIIDNNLLPNCPVSRSDVIRAEDIFGPDVGSLKGKTVRHTPKQVKINDYEIPSHILENYRDVTIGVDIMFINKMAFLVTMSRDIKFCTCEMIRNMKSNTILHAIIPILKLYESRGFKVICLLMDGQFESIRKDLNGINVMVNITSRDEHVPEVERQIRTLKERIRSILNTLPFKTIPDQMLVELVYGCVFWLNIFPPIHGVSPSISPRTLMTGMKIDFHKHCQLEFGDYVQTHEEHGNSMESRTIGAIALRPTGNIQGGYYFLSLLTGRKIKRYSWTKLPMPSEVIERIDQLANENQSFTQKNTITDESDDIYEETMTVDTTAGQIELELRGDNENAPIELDSTSNNDNEGNVYNLQINNTNNSDNEVDNITDDLSLEDDVSMTFIEDEEAIHDFTAEMDEKYGNRESSYNLRPRRPRNYSHLFMTINHYAMTQYSLKKGIQVFGDEGVAAVISELKQLHDRHVIEPMYENDITMSERRKALPYLMFLKKKRSGLIKGRGCADGRSQRLDIQKEEASSPTVALESVLLTSLIDATECRDVATVDIPGAFLHADIDDTVHMRFDGKMAELLTQIDPKLYRKFILNDNKKPVLYVKLRKAIYGTMKAALLFWTKLTNTIKGMGFEINPYDECVGNKVINSSTCTIVWHVDDLKISHKEPKVVSDIISKLSEVFGVEAPLSVTRGKSHDYLGMNLDFSHAGKIIITMKEYINDIIDSLPSDMNGTASTPAANHLFEVNDSDPEYLSEDDAMKFHRYVAKLLFLCKRARPDIHTAVAFLSTRVKRPDYDDYKKLSRVMKYLQETKDLHLTLETNNIGKINWWIDASYAIHPDMRSHTGGVMIIGKGALYTTSTRQKLTTRSSTEGELVGVHDVLPQVLWTRYFLQHQGIIVTENKVYQDNRSAILLENNGKRSSSKRTKHINVRYFFVKDRINNGEVTITHCPTEEMIADFFTKPLQGTLFTKFRKLILNNED